MRLLKHKLPLALWANLLTLQCNHHNSVDVRDAARRPLQTDVVLQDVFRDTNTSVSGPDSGAIDTVLVGVAPSRTESVLTAVDSQGRKFLVILYRIACPERLSRGTPRLRHPRFLVVENASMRDLPLPSELFLQQPSVQTHRTPPFIVHHSSGERYYWPTVNGMQSSTTIPTPVPTNAPSVNVHLEVAPFMPDVMHRAPSGSHFFPECTLHLEYSRLGAAIVRFSQVFPRCGTMHSSVADAYGALTVFEADLYYDRAQQQHRRYDIFEVTEHTNRWSRIPGPDYQTNNPLVYGLSPVGRTIAWSAPISRREGHLWQHALRWARWEESRWVEHVPFIRNETSRDLLIGLGWELNGTPWIVRMEPNNTQDLDIVVYHLENNQWQPEARISRDWHTQLPRECEIMTSLLSR